MDKIIALLKKLGAKEHDIEEAQGEIDSLVTTGIDEATKGLKAKNSELIGKLKNKDDGAEGKVVELENELDTLRTKLSTAEKTAQKALNDKSRIEKELGEQLGAEKSAMSTLLIDNGLTKELATLKVKPEHLPYVKAGLMSRVALEGDGADRKAIVTFTKDGKEGKMPLSEYMQKEWAAGEGKAFIPAALNSGSGAGAPGGSGTAKTMSRAEFDALPPSSKASFSREGGQLTD